MKALKKMIMERLCAVNECGGGYSPSCGGGYSSASYGSGTGGGKAKTGATTLKKLTSLAYGDAFEFVKHADMLVKEAKRVGKTMPSDMEQRLGAVRKAA